MCIALTPSLGGRRDGSVRAGARQDCDGTRPTGIGRSGPTSGQLLRSGPMPTAASGQVRCMTPPGSVIPRVTPTATDLRPGSSPNYWAVSQSFHRPQLNRTRPHPPETPPNLTEVVPLAVEVGWRPDG